MSRRVLVLYATTHGQTAKIARCIAGSLILAGEAVLLSRVDELPDGTDPDDFAGVVIGAPLIVGRHPRAIRRYVRRHRHALNDMPSAFFSVSASAASRDERGLADARRCLASFEGETGWYPPLTETIGGAIAYTRYNPLLRWWMRRICARAGGPTDTSRDHELTDWPQVERFAASFAAVVSRARSNVLATVGTGV